MQKQIRYNFSANAEEIVIFPAKFAELIISLLKTRLIDTDPHIIIDNLRKELEVSKFVEQPIKASVKIAKEYVEYQEFIDLLATDQFDLEHPINLPISYKE